MPAWRVFKFVHPLIGGDYGGDCGDYCVVRGSYVLGLERLLLHFPGDTTYGEQPFWASIDTRRWDKTVQLAVIIAVTFLIGARAQCSV